MPNNELKPPPEAVNNREAQEMLRAWIVNNGLQCSLQVGILGEDEATVWGILLSDVARHVAAGLQQKNRDEEAKTLQASQKAFNFELDHPTAEVKGGLV